MSSVLKPVWPHMPLEEQGATATVESFCIHVFAQKSKSCEHGQVGISGKQVLSHFILYKSKPTPGPGLRTMALEWDAVHLAPRCKCAGCIPLSSNAGFESDYRTHQQRVGCGCKLLTSRLITAGEVSLETAARRGGNCAVNEGEARSAPEVLELCPSSHTLQLSPGSPAIVL